MHLSAICSHVFIYIFIYTQKHEWDQKIWEEMITSFGSHALSYLSAKVNKEKNKQHVSSLVLLTFPKIKKLKACRELKAVTVQNISLIVCRACKLKFAGGESM